MEPRSFSSSFKKNLPTTIVTRILAACFHHYTGDPLGVTGHALKRALSISNSVSNGLFTEKTNLSPIRTYEEYFQIRSDIEAIRMSIFEGYGQKGIYKFPLYQPTCITFDITGINERIEVGNWFKLGGRKNSGYGQFRIIDKTEIDLNGITLPNNVIWTRLVTPLSLRSIPQFFERKNLQIGNQWFYNKFYRKKIPVVEAGQIFHLKEGLKKRFLHSIMISGIKRIGYGASMGLGEYQCF
jgi:hypothetical protein